MSRFATADARDMNTRFTRENRILCNELVESKPINAMSNGGAREKVKELYKPSYYVLLYSCKFGNIPETIKIQIAVRTLENIENEKSSKAVT